MDKAYHHRGQEATRAWGIAIFTTNIQGHEMGTPGRPSAQQEPDITSAVRAGAAAATATAAVATATAESATLGAGTRFVHVQGAAVQFLTVQTLDGFHGLGLIGHLDKGEAAGLAGVAIANNAGLFNGAVRGKRSLELGLRGLISKVSNKNIRH